MSFEYKTVGAPEKGKRRRGARTASDRAAVAMDEILQDEATDGWEYLRTDILPLSERRGWFGGTHEAHRAVMVFRRPLNKGAAAARADQHDDVDLPLRTAPVLAPEVPRGGRREPDVSADPDLLLAEVVRGPGQRKLEER